MWQSISYKRRKKLDREHEHEHEHKYEYEHEQAPITNILGHVYNFLGLL